MKIGLSTRLPSTSAGSAPATSELSIRPELCTVVLLPQAGALTLVDKVACHDLDPPPG
jgi:hypothetical protein